MTITDLPLLNASLNSLTAILLIIGYRYIKNGDEVTHKKFMLGALGSSTIFLTSYLIYHYYVGSIPYPYHNWTRPVYFTILIPHVILAALMIPFILTGVWFAIKGKFDQHKRLMKIVFPVWIFVSISGVLVYLMLYQL